MLTLSAGRVAEVTGGELVAGAPEVMLNGFVTDSRAVEPGCAFVAFRGDHSDGHAHVAEALAAGARGAVVTRWDEALEAEVGAVRGAAVVVKVADATAALTALAMYHRSRLACPVLGITGSTGKTSAKDFVASVLSTRLRVTATRSNNNNELGVPLTVLEAGSETDVLVVEMGMRGPGQIAALCTVARPTLGLVTNVGQAHMELLGDQEAILHAKGELLECLPSDGRAFLNGDDEFSRRLAQSSPAPVTFYGAEPSDDVSALDLQVDDDGRPTMTIKAGGECVTVTLPVPGRHNAYNAAAAAAVALHLGLDLQAVAEGLASARLSDMRMQVFTTPSGITVVNDAYNANPTSMRAAVGALLDMSPGGKRVAVLGDMAELGSLADLAHFRLGEEVGAGGVDVLVTVGALARRIAEGARAVGMDPDAVRPCADADGASEVLDDVLSAGDVVLVKASRCMGLERVVEGIMSPRV